MMQIGSYTPRFSMPLENRSKISGTAKTASVEKAPEKEDFSSHFSGPDDVTVTHTASGGTQYQMSSPSMRLEAQWERWRAQLGEDPDADLPDSTGWTEENVEYLKNRYSADELTWVERQDALETMRKLGMVSYSQISLARGGRMYSFKGTILENGCAVGDPSDPGLQEMLDKMKADVLNPKNPLERDWNVLFKGDPIAGFLTIDDILDWAKELPDETWDPWRMRMEGAAQSVQ